MCENLMVTDINDLPEDRDDIFEDNNPTVNIEGPADFYVDNNPQNPEIYENKSQQP